MSTSTTSSYEMNIEDMSNLDKIQIIKIPINDRKTAFFKFMVQKTYTSMEQFNNVYQKSLRKFRINMSKTELHNMYNNSTFKNARLEHYCVHISSRSHSGVCVIATIMAPVMLLTMFGKKVKRAFTCKYDCAFCPDPPGGVRSYPPEEPVPMRGSQNEYDVVRQAHSRMLTLTANHHIVDKLEWLILGGTWSSFPLEYREHYHCSIFFAANLWSEGINVVKLFKTFPIGSNADVWRTLVRPMLSIEEEMEINRISKCRVIGITIETRPDEINLDEIRVMRRLGTTRIQMGFQHTDNEVLRKNRRGCSIEQCEKGLKILLDNGFKVDGHWMPDLPGSNPEKDREMITRAFTCSKLRCDQIKLYPCQVLDHTLIKKWYDSGEYKPYGEFDFNELLELLIYAKSIMPAWVRTNRVVRDFPKKIIRGGLDVTHIHDLVIRELKTRGINCMCIRCREVKRREVNYDDTELTVREYDASGGREHFISMEIPDEKSGSGGILLGFCRLRINSNDLDLEHQFPELHGCALIRELHVYGNTTSFGAEHTQHRGFGKKLVAKAEEIARANGYDKIAVISGIGVQNYYQRLGFKDGFYMVKNLNQPVKQVVRGYTTSHIAIMMFTLFMAMMIALVY